MKLSTSKAAEVDRKATEQTLCDVNTHVVPASRRDLGLTGSDLSLLRSGDEATVKKYGGLTPIIRGTYRVNSTLASLE